jgi:predicted dehydrogenase
VEASGYANHVAFPEMRNDDCQVALFRFDNGAAAKVAALYGPRTERPVACNLRLYGTKGSVERDQVAIAGDEEDVHPSFRTIEVPETSGHPYEPEIEDWLDSILEDGTPRCSLFDGANSTVAALIAAEAMNTGKALPVPVY